MSKMKALLAAATLISAIGASAWADLPGQHPNYLHSLTDLRTARSLLSHQPGDAKVYGDEDIAIQEINAAINEIKKASIDDGKNLNDHPQVDTKEQGSRLLRSIETLKKARTDIARQEDNPSVREMQSRALGHIDAAIEAADRAHAQWLVDVGKR